MGRTLSTNSRHDQLTTIPRWKDPGSRDDLGPRLETASAAGTLQAFSGETNLFIRPGHVFHGFDALITNFHLPRSSLLVLVSAFAGVDLIRAAYAEAVQARYRFFSYGDAMLIL